MEVNFPEYFSALKIRNEAEPSRAATHSSSAREEERTSHTSKKPTDVSRDGFKPVGRVPPGRRQQHHRLDKPCKRCELSKSN
ncbi:hypothetical protein ZHAS_00009214 [Anopheles sinensis]|uniref:Uncharacterized protein n=1 Tax=Anopheles sinensis TaxID=74873 RepID=A0A084VUF8_ANOSI|nr:hypothetical protein ZHAS_00009214 [Anopheles sinensis]